MATNLRETMHGGHSIEIRELAPQIIDQLLCGKTILARDFTARYSNLAERENLKQPCVIPYINCMHASSLI
jgi:hypothetical protein